MGSHNPGFVYIAVGIRVKIGRSQDGGGIGRVITFSSTNSLKEQQNGEQSLQNNFSSLAADIRRPEKQSIVFEGR